MCTCQPSANTSNLETIVATATKEFLAVVERERNLRDIHQSAARSRKDLQRQNTFDCDHEAHDLIMRRAEETFLHSMRAADAQCKAALERAKLQLLEQFGAVFDLFNTTAHEIDRVRTEASKADTTTEPCRRVTEL